MTVHVRREIAVWLDRLRKDVLAQRSALTAGSATTGPAALHVRRAANRLEVVVVEIDATLRHLRRAVEASDTVRQGPEAA